jgi:hypothetical protein
VEACFQECLSRTAAVVMAERAPSHLGLALGLSLAGQALSTNLKDAYAAHPPRIALARPPRIGLGGHPALRPWAEHYEGCFVRRVKHTARTLKNDKLFCAVLLGSGAAFVGLATRELVRPASGGRWYQGC